MCDSYVKFSTFLRKKYGETVYRIPIDIGFSCPNRSEFRGQGGCTFCSGTGARAQHLTDKIEITDQVKAGIQLAKERYHAKVFMAYFQAYTSTYAPIKIIRELFETVLAEADFKIVVISTRPDCLPEPVLDYLSELAQRYDLWIELGAQTVHDVTLERINRGHSFACSKMAIQKLSQRHIKVAAHVILGLPGETREMIRQTAMTLAKLPLSGIKIHNLHIVQDTILAKEYQRGEVVVWDEQEYGEVLMEFLRLLPRDWPIMRLVSETPRHELIAPHWWLNKSQFLEYIQYQMKCRGWQQGDLFDNINKDNISLPISVQHIKDDDDVIWIAKFLKLFSQETLIIYILPIEFGFFLEKVQKVASLLKKKIEVHLIGGHLLRYSQWCETEAVLPITIRKSAFYKNMSECTWFYHWGNPSEQISKLPPAPCLVLLQITHLDQAKEFYDEHLWKLLAAKFDDSSLIFTPCRDRKLRKIFKSLGFLIGEYPLSKYQYRTLAGMHSLITQYPLSEKEQRLIEGNS